MKRFWPNFFNRMMATLILHPRFDSNFNLSKFEFCLNMAFFTKAVSAQKSLWSDFDQISSNECWQNWFTISQNSLFTFRWILIPNLWASNSVSKRHFVKSKLHSKVTFKCFWNNFLNEILQNEFFGIRFQTLRQNNFNCG